MGEVVGLRYEGLEGNKGVEGGRLRAIGRCRGAVSRERKREVLQEAFVD